MNAKIPACQVNYNGKEQAQCTKSKHHLKSERKPLLSDTVTICFGRRAEREAFRCEYPAVKLPDGSVVGSFVSRVL